MPEIDHGRQPAAVRDSRAARNPSKNVPAKTERSPTNRNGAIDCTPRAIARYVEPRSP
jgi:hypothetical protein